MWHWPQVVESFESFSLLNLNTLLKWNEGDYYIDQRKVIFYLLPEWFVIVGFRKKQRDILRNIVICFLANRIFLRESNEHGDQERSWLA